MNRPLGRRRFLGIAAAMAGLALPPSAAALAGDRAAAGLRVWRGVALGADAVLQIHHDDPVEADRLITLSLAEIARLERVFSLYRPDSALVRLNRDGALDDPPLDLVRLLSDSARVSRLTGGAFDPTVQPLWRLHADHFAVPGADPEGPPASAIRRATALVDWRGVSVDAGRIALARPGMALTLNGIAQGYVTDRVVELLRDQGMTRVLADLGETRALGRHPSGRPWTVGLEDPERPGRLTRTLELDGGAVATSGGYGTRFEPTGCFHHLFDPATGHCPRRWRAVSVLTATATMADALSTAFSVMAPEPAEAVLAAAGGGQVFFTRA